MCTYESIDTRSDVPGLLAALESFPLSDTPGNPNSAVPPSELDIILLDSGSNLPIVVVAITTNLTTRPQHNTADNLWKVCQLYNTPQRSHYPVVEGSSWAKLAAG